MARKRSAKPPSAVLRSWRSTRRWKRALAKYGVTHLTVQFYGRDERLIFGPVHPTPLFELLAPGHHALSMFAACVRRCLTQPAGASTIVVEQRHGFVIIESSLTLDDVVFGAAVAGHVLTPLGHGGGSRSGDEPSANRSAADNLLDNAAKYTPPRRHIAVMAAREENAEAAKS